MISFIHQNVMKFKIHNKVFLFFAKGLPKFSYLQKNEFASIKISTGNCSTLREC